MTIRASLILPLALFAAAVISGCSGENHDAEESDLSAAALMDRPWEISSEKGETYLANIFYAEASENEQVMPLTIEGDRYQIDRLIYPTIGNPNLYTHEDSSDSLMIVTRLEPSLLRHLQPREFETANSNLHDLSLKSDSDNTVQFYLVPRSSRAIGTEPNTSLLLPEADGIIRIEPSTIQIHSIPSDMPPAFRSRRTLRFSFDQKAMSHVPPGLYDLRMEIKSQGELIDLPNGAPAYEYQYNAVRVFDRAPQNGEYSVVNIADTQLGIVAPQASSLTNFRDLVQFLSTTEDASIRNAAFMVFNGDLHNATHASTVWSSDVAACYQREAKAILGLLRELPLPVFLIPGNHDGYAATGIRPKAFAELEDTFGDALERAVEEAEPKAWPDFSWLDYRDYLDELEELGLRSGKHLDLFLGSHVRRVATTFKDSWIPVPRENRNMVLYDGFHQWQRTYGPLYMSWSFGQNRYVGLNTFDLRQHRRAGWGTYTTNYGGGISPVQFSWMDKEVKRAKVRGEDVVLLAHHDPRGGHEGVDHSYYFEQLDFAGIFSSAIHYVDGIVVNKAFCGLVPDWMKSEAAEEDCLHDGLEEWMKADAEFDCTDAERLPSGVCDPRKFDPKSGGTGVPLYSAYQFLNLITSNDHIRTLLLGHTHFNSFEVLQSGDEIVPTAPLESSAEDLAKLEATNPIRGYAWQVASGEPVSFEYDPNVVPSAELREANEETVSDLETLGRAVNAEVKGDAREIVIARLACIAKETGQSYKKRPLSGFSVWNVRAKSDSRLYSKPQLNEFRMYGLKDHGFFKVRDVLIDRTARLGPRDENNPVDRLFDTRWGFIDEKGR